MKGLNINPKTNPTQTDNKGLHSHLPHCFPEIGPKLQYSLSLSFLHFSLRFSLDSKQVCSNYHTASSTNPTPQYNTTQSYNTTPLYSTTNPIIRERKQQKKSHPYLTNQTKTLLAVTWFRQAIPDTNTEPRTKRTQYPQYPRNRR